MPKPNWRPFFQIHLSTAIVLMFTAGVLIWANLTISVGDFSVMYGNKWQVVQTNYGLPFLAFQRDDVANWRVSVVGYKPRESLAVVSYTGCLGDALFLLIVLFFVSRICELIIRRRSSKKAP